MKHLPIEPLESRIAPATLAIGSPTPQTEGDSGEKNFVFTVSLDAAAAAAVTVNFHTADGTATVMDNDYTEQTGTLTFQAGEVSKTITVKVKGDLVGEADETFNVILDTPSVGSTIATGTGTGTILNDAKLSISSAISQFEGNTGLTAYNFTVSLTERAPTGNVSVEYLTQDGATDTSTDAATVADNDYVQILATSLVFAEGTDTKTITAQVVGDTVQEKLENFRVRLQNPVGAAISGVGFGIAEIKNDPLRITSLSQAEGSSGVSQMVFQVTLSDYAGGYPVQVTYLTPANTGNATPDGDFLNVPNGSGNTLTFAQGETVKTISVPIYGDTIGEDNETFTLSATAKFVAPTGGGSVLPDFSTTATGTILNDDISVSIDDASSNSEGNAGSTNTSTFTVQFAGRHTDPVTVHYRTVNGTGPRGAVSGADFAGVTDGTLVFPNGLTSQNLTINLVGDAVGELTENFRVEIFQIDATGFTTSITDAFGTGTIKNDDVSASIVADAAAIEGDSGTKQFGFTVNLTSAFSSDVVLGYKTINGTATTANSDYIPVVDGLVTILAGQTSARIFVPVRGDLVKEGNETFSVELADPPLDTLLGTKTATATIIDDDPSVSIGDVTVVEGNAGTTTALFTVRLSAAPAANETVTVNFETADSVGAAAALSIDDARRDYITQIGVVTFAAGETVKTIAVQVVGDLRYETDETFLVNLTSASLSKPGVGAGDPPPVVTPYTIKDGQGLGTIQDTAAGTPVDPRPSLAISPSVSVSEGGVGQTTNASFTVSLSAAADNAVTVNYGTLAGTAIAGDFSALTGTLTFAPGETSKQISVVVNGDTLLEADETFQVVLSSGSIAVGAGQALTFTQDKSTATILNDETTVAFFGAAPTFTEGASGTMDFVVRLSAAHTVPVVVNYATRDVDGGPGPAFAVAGSDYTAKTGTLTFAPGETQKTISIAVLNELVDEDNQTFEVALTSVTNASIAGSVATGTIVDNDATPTVSIGATASVNEGDANSPASVAVTLSAPSDREVTVKYASAPGTATSAADLTATPAADFQTLALTTLTFAPGETSKSIPVTLRGDLLDEANETFTLTLSAPSANVTLGNAVSTVTIVDNDAAPALSIADVSGLEGAGPHVFKVRLSEISGLPVSVTFNTVNGTATAGSDFTATTGLLTFAPGEIEKTISVPITSETIDERDEQFLVRLTAPTNASILDGEATGKIINDDNVFSIQNATVNEEGAGNAAQTVTLRVSRTGSLASSVDFATLNGTATSTGARPDFTAKSGTLSFAAGETFKDITVAITKDSSYELNENFTVALSNALDGLVAAGATGTGTVTITDNDVAPTMTIESSTVTEGVGGGSLIFRVLLSAANERETPSVQFETVDGTAVSTGGALRDFTAKSDILRFENGSTQQLVSIAVNNDTVDEDDQTFQVRLKNPNLVAFAAGGATISATGTLVDNDDAPTVSVNDLTFAETESGNTGKVFTVSLSSESDRVVTVSVSTLAGTAKAGEDFTALPATLLTFAPGEKTKTLFVPVIDDNLDEAAETFEVVLATPTNATLGDARGLGTIPVNDADQQVQISINDLTVVEGEALGEALFTVSLSAASGRAVTVDFATHDGSATSSGAFLDFTAKSGTVTFAPGETSKTISIPIVGDIYREGVAHFGADDATYTIVDEKFSVELSTPANATLGDKTGEATIANGNDTIVGVAVSDVAVTEGANATTKNATVNFTLSVPSIDPVTLTAATRNGTAVAGSDFTALSQVVTFGGDTTTTETVEGLPVTKTRPGATTATFAVQVSGDNVFEATENFFVDVSGISSNARLVGADAGGKFAIRGTIFNDDIQLLNGGQTLQWVDVDGDLVTMTTTRGSFAGIQGATFTTNGQTKDWLQVVGDVGGRQLNLLSLVNLGGFAGASISITADAQPGFAGTTDGRVNVGEIRAAIRLEDQLQFSGIDLGKITVDGDVARIVAGDSFSTPAIQMLDVYSLGALGTTTGSASTTSDILGPIGTVHVHSTLEGFLSVVGREFGSIGKLQVDGAIQGGSAASSGVVRVTGRINTVEIGALIGGSGAASGRIEGDPSTVGASIGKVTIEGAIIGGAGTNSGTLAASSIGNVTAKAIFGGAGASSGRIDGTTLGNVTLDGELTGGTGDGSGVIIGTTVGNVTVAKINGGTELHAGTTQDPFSNFLSGAVRTLGTIGKVHVLGDIKGGTGETSGAIVVGARGGAITIDGDLIGGTRSQAGTVATFGSIDSVTVNGRLIGGDGLLSGSIIANVNAATAIGSVLVKGSVTGGLGATSGRIAAGKLGNVTVDSLSGGAGADSGSIFSNSTVGKVSVVKGVLGGVGATSGAIGSLGDIASVRIGGNIVGGAGASSGIISSASSPSVTVVGGVVGGDGAGSGSVLFAKDVRKLSIGKESGGDSVKGGAGVQSGRVAITANLADGTLAGNIRGGANDRTGGLVVGGNLNHLTIAGDIIGGSAGSTGAARVNSGFLQAGLLANATIAGSVVVGTDGGAGLTNSGVIRTGRIGSLTINGNVTGTAGVPAVISAAATIDASNVGIAKLIIKGKADFAEILSGYNGVTGTGFRGALVSADAQIGTVEIQGSTHSTNIVAGVLAGTGGRFGDATDVLGSGTGVRDSASVISQIASVILKGSILANADTFGVVAQHLLAVRLGASGVPLAGLGKGSGNDTATALPDASDEIGAVGSKFRAVEIAV